MVWKFDEKSPIYLQIADRIKLQIISQELVAGDQLPTVRELAELAGVNPNTMQRAFAHLEQDGMVFSNRTAGRYVTENQDLIARERHRVAEAELDAFVSKMGKIGFSKHEIITELESYLKGERE
ncbi:GntR family transcriptional regulator [Streptococcus sp. SGI.013]|uniref:DNA-binding transcriptional regulator YhcF (GntR family) n=1 Tax=Streptococcus porcorum TaxID=701526 RepID=A0ABV2JES5_9STRE